MEGKYLSAKEIDNIIEENDYLGIRDQDGWETLELTVRMKYKNQYITDQILFALE